MKKTSLLNVVTLFGIGAATLIFATGCSTCRDVRGTRDLVQVDAIPGAADKGYVEFFSPNERFPVPIYYVDNRGQAIPLGSVGLKQGDHYCFERNGYVGERLRVAVPAGNHTFMIERQGKIIQVPVQSGQLTPVEVNYRVVDTAMQFVAYRLDTHILAPGAVPAPAPAPKG